MRKMLLKKLKEKTNNNDVKKEDKEKIKTNKKFDKISIVAHESEKPFIVFEEINSEIPYHYTESF